MFTGLITAIGEVAGIRDRAGVREIRIRSPFPPSDLRKGASVAIQGVCLTLIEDGSGEGTFRVGASRETLRRTTLSRIRTAEKVHLERALAVGDRLGGHIVQGHVDGIGQVGRASRLPGERVIEIIAPGDLMPYIVEKGSIAVDGVSLTVGRVGPSRFRVHIIPATMEATLLGRYRPGRKVNLEVDVIAKYVAARIRRDAGASFAGVAPSEEGIG